MLRSCNIVTLVLLHCRGVPGTGHCCTGALAAGKHADDEVDDDDGDVDDDDDDEEDVDDVDDDDNCLGWFTAHAVKSFTLLQVHLLLGCAANF